MDGLDGWVEQGWLGGTGEGSLVGAPAGSSAALCVDRPRCGWRGSVVVRQLVVFLDVGVGAGGLGCGHPCGVGLGRDLRPHRV